MSILIYVIIGVSVAVILLAVTAALYVGSRGAVAAANPAVNAAAMHAAMNATDPPTSWTVIQPQPNGGLSIYRKGP